MTSPQPPSSSTTRTIADVHDIRLLTATGPIQVRVRPTTDERAKRTPDR